MLRKRSKLKTTTQNSKFDSSEKLEIRGRLKFLSFSFSVLVPQEEIL